MRRSLRKNKNGKKRGIIFIVIALLLTTSAFLLYSMFWKETQTFISPIASGNKNVSKTLEKLLLSSEIEFSSVTFRSPSSYLVKLKEDGEAILSLDKDFKEQITSLQAVMKQLTIEGKRVIRIDFRFDKPVIELQ